MKLINLANKSTELYQVREKAVKVVKIIEERISKLANKPKEFETKLEELMLKFRILKISKLLFHSQLRKLN